jgi:hypothetical protein
LPGINQFILTNSSSFIEPPATEHHQWSGAKKKAFLIIFYTEAITLTITREVSSLVQVGGSAACAAGGPLTAAEPLFEEDEPPPREPPREPPLVKPGKGGWRPGGALKRGAGRKLVRAGIGKPDSEPDSYNEDESARGRLVDGAGGAGCAAAAAETGGLRKRKSIFELFVLQVAVPVSPAPTSRERTSC